MREHAYLLLVAAVSVAAAAPRNAGEAKARVETALEKVEAAVAKVAKPAPRDADLDAAMQRIDALKVVLDEGSDFEPKDLDYARTALKARKAYRTHRDFVEERRRAAKVEKTQEFVDEALAALDGATKKLSAPTPSDADFRSAKNAAKNVEETLKTAAEVGKEDDGLKKHLAAVAAKLAKHREAIDRHEARVVLTVQRGLVDEALRSMQETLAAVDGDAPTDPQFQAAQAAADHVLELIESKRSFERFDRGYAGFASKAERSAKAAKSKIDQRWSAVGLARLRAEVEPVRKDLTNAAKALRGRAPTDAQLAEVRSAVIVMEKLLERFEPIRTKSKAFRAYFDDVDQGLVDIQVDLQKQRMEGARESLARAMSGLSQPDVTEAQFAAAEEEVAEGEKILAEGERLEKKVRAYASYALSVSKRLAEAKAEIAELRTAAAVGRHKMQIEPAKEALETALRALAQKNPSDDVFAETKTAAIVLEKTLDGAHTRDARFARYVLDLRQLVADARARLESRRIEVDVERQRAVVQDARTDLARTLKRASWKSAGDAEFGAASAAIDALEKAVAASKTLADADKEFGKYIDVTKNWIQDAHVEVRRYRVTAADDAVDASLQRLPGPKDLAEAEAKVAALEKQLELGLTHEKTDRTYARVADGARSTIAKARARVEARRDELAVEAQELSVTNGIEALKGVVSTLSFTPSGENFSAADKASAEVDKRLASGAALEKKISGYAKWAAGARKSVDELKQQIEKRRIEVAVGGAEQNLTRLMDDARAAVASARVANASDADVSKAGHAVSAADQALRANARLETRDRSYGKLATKLKAELEQLSKDLVVAQQVIAFRKGPLASLAAGTTAAASAAKTSDIGAAKRAYLEAIAQFDACKKKSANMIGDHPRMADATVFVGRDPHPAKDVIGLCGDHSAAAQKELAAVQTIIDFHEGPARSYLEGTKTERSGAKAEALKHYEKCLSSGKILLYKHPELKERKLDVGGRKMTLPEVISGCSEGADRLR